MMFKTFVLRVKTAYLKAKAELGGKMADAGLAMEMEALEDLAKLDT